MKKKNNAFLYLLGKLPRTAWMVLAGVVVGMALMVAILSSIGKGNQLSIGTDDRIQVTPTQIRSIERIGEWEFLSVSDEELVDTVRHGFFGDDELVRIYYGTIRLGIDLRDAQEGWIETQGDSIQVLLPPIRLLDEDFIDEAKTRSFFESGSWNAQAREALYQKAYHAMKQRCLTPQNIRSAEDNACAQFFKMLTGMGYENVRVRIQRTPRQRQETADPQRTSGKTR